MDLTFRRNRDAGARISWRYCSREGKVLVLAAFSVSSVSSRHDLAHLRASGTKSSLIVVALRFHSG